MKNSRIETLIKKLCPDGVEFKKLKDITFSIKTGLNPRQNFILNTPDATNYYVTVKEITSGKIRFGDKTDKINEDARKKIQSRSDLEEGDVLFSGIGTIGKVALVDIPTDNWNCSESVFLIKPRKSLIEPQFLAYVLSSEFVEKQYNSQSVGSTLRGVRLGTLAEIKIPLPPLDIQKEIVKILNEFTELEAELEAELESRKKQYEYYRDQLLTFNKDIERKALEQIAEYAKERIDIAKLDQDNYVGVDNLLQNKQGKKASEFVPMTGRCTKYGVGNILVGNIRPYLRKIWLADNIGGANGDVLVVSIKDKENVEPKYLYYVLSSEDFFHYDAQNSRGTKMPRGDKTMIMKYQIPIPPLSEQKKIVSILDKFDSLVNDISIGLPAELKARRKQYEYYRNKLLTFKEYGK